MAAPRSVDLVIRARWIVPVEPEGVLDDHALVVDRGEIVAIVASADAERAFVAAERVDLPTHVLLPGLVNAHTHAAMNLLRGIADDVPLKAWLEQHIWPREGRFVSPEFVHDGTLLAAAEMLRGGVTCASDMYFFPDAAARAFEAAGMRALVGMPVLDFPTPYAADADDYLQKGLAARDAFKDAPHLAFALAPHAPYTVSDATWAKVTMYARQLDLPIQTHVAETQREVEDSRRATGETPVERLERLGVTGPTLIAVHAVHLGDGDIGKLAAQRCSVVHCPASNMKLASGVAQRSRHARREASTSRSAPTARPPTTASTCSPKCASPALLAKVSSGDAAAVPAATALRMATLDGAIALGMDDRIGSLTAGKAADAIAVDLGGLDIQPVYDPVSHLVNAAGRSDVSDVWIAGRRVVESGALTTIDAAALAGRTATWRQRLA